MKKRIMNGLMVFFIMVALGSGGYLVHYYYASSKSEGAVDQLREQVVWQDESSQVNQEDGTVQEEKSPMVNVDGVEVQKKFEKLYQENHDFVGWLTIADTNIDYPVMYTPNDSEYGEYYLHRDFDGQNSSAGLPFIDKNCDFRKPTDNVIIYGHNMNSGKMFHDLIKYEDREFYETHKTFTFDTIAGDGVYEVIAAFYGEILPDESDQFKYYEFVNAGSAQEFQSYVENVKRMSICDTGVEVSYGDKLVTLSTCAYHVKNGRFAVIAKKMQ